jgi:Ca2+-transporting ATPase
MDKFTPLSAPDHHLDSPEAVARRLQVDPAQGLALDEVQRRQARHGPNRLAETAPRPWWMRLLAPLLDTMTLVLLAAALISGLIGDLADTVVIAVIVVLNTVISAVQEWQADQALAALQRLATHDAQVRRDGQVGPVPADQLVPGDVVLLEAGDQVPADLRLHQVAQLRTDESALTGESQAVDKQPAALPTPGPGQAHALGERSNMAWKGTLVTHGRATGLVVATGAGTELGRIAGLLAQAERRSTPLQQRLTAFGRRLSTVVLGLCAVVFAIGVLRGEPVLLMGLTAISLAVAAIPEALPAVVTVLLALGARRLVRVQALVRQLPAVETLGSVTTICSDKTGTLTRNRMQVQAWRLADPAGPTPEALLREAALRCNDARARPQGWQGEPTEVALAEWACPAGDSTPAAPRLREWPFDAERRRMSTLTPATSAADEAPAWLWVKGAPETLLPRCTQAPGPWLAQAEALAGEGMRVLALARRRLDPQTLPAQAGADEVERDLTLLGLVGLIDPPRPEAAAAVAECRAAGIRPVMITGDHPGTARAIAQAVGIVEDAQAPVLTGAELARMDDALLGARVAEVAVYARMDPAQKIRIVRALQARGEFVAMTGDGVNDAPALKAADIDVAMGLGGTDVAREASSLVLLDDHFATIVAAVREGRRIFDNIRKFIRYALTGNSGEIWVLFLAPLLGLPVPLLPIHILWVNLVTDGLPGLALAGEPAERGVMQRPPRAPGESIFAHGLWQHALWVGLLIGALCLGLQAWALQVGDTHWQSMVFTTLTLTQMAHLLAIRSETEPLWRLGLGSNRPLLGAVLLSVALQLATLYVPALQAIFHTQALDAAELGLCFAAAGLVWAVVEVEKAWRRRTARSQSPAQNR